MRTLKVLLASLMARTPVAPLLLVAVATVWGPGVGAAQGLSATQIARIDSSVTAVIERHHIPGLSIAIVADGELRWQKAYGLADVENSVPARTTTVTSSRTTRSSTNLVHDTPTPRSATRCWAR